MILQHLEIELARWGDNKGKFVGKATFSGKQGSVTLNLNDHHIEEIFRTCADSIVETARAAARHLTMAVIDQQKALETDATQEKAKQ